MKKLFIYFMVLFILLGGIIGCSKKTEESLSNTNNNYELKTDTGRYQGLADNNFFEVKISGVPEQNAARVFMITDEIRKKFEDLKLKKDDIVKIDYIVNKKNQLEVKDIKRLENK